MGKKCKEEVVKRYGTIKTIDAFNYLFEDIAYIYELSEEGKTKDAIIFPSIIENYKTGLGVKFGIMIPNKVILESNNIASIYFNSDIIIDTYMNNAVYFSITDIENIRIFFISLELFIFWKSYVTSLNNSSYIYQIFFFILDQDS